MGNSATKNLVVVESPAKARTINKILGKNYKVAASVGHIMDLPKSKFGVDIENGYTPSFTVIRGKSKVIKQLQEEAKRAGEVLIATDPDREGEAIAYHIAQRLKPVNGRIRRIEFNEITRSAVLRALEQPRDIDMNRVNAQQARRVMDRIVGYMVSPLLWKTIYRGLSAGRVQSVALRLICEREQEIEAFTPVEYWTLEAELEPASGERFVARLYSIDGQVLDPKKFRIGSQGEAEQHYRALQQEQYVVADVRKERARKNPPPPFITSTLQQDAARRLRLSTAQIMRLAQQLYEGVDLGDRGTVGLITYMRTDSTRVSKEAQASARQYIAEAYGSDYLPEKPNVYRSKKGAQDAHEAIRPTYLSAEFEPRRLKAYLSAEQYKIYELIWKRFLASQMKPAEVERTTIEVAAGKYRFRATGEVVVFRGYLQIYQEADESLDAAENGRDAAEVRARPAGIPRHISTGDALRLLELIMEQHFTKPPPRYTESTLVKTLDKLGIGRPSTYAQIISTLFQRKYVERVSRALKPTELGRVVNDLLVKYFPNIFNVKFTAAMEAGLDRIEQNLATYRDTLDEFYHPFQRTLEEVSGKIKEIKSGLQEATKEKCEVCGRPMVVKWGRNGRFLACSGYPECKNTRPLEEPEQPVQVNEVCKQCGSPMVVRRGRFGEFLACSKYPECKYTQPISTGVACPEEGCSGTIVQRQSRKGKIFYSCSEYPKCKFALWNRPVGRSCPQCGYPLMEERMSKKEGYFLRCPQCKHKEVVEPAEKLALND
ncbi:MAG: type I DNA topoisomerase [Calditrichaeota bacterium]|nr:MAG: type I DNA topoisomerase [Calditrichota bacterium]